MADCRKCKHNYKPSTCEPKCNRMCDGESDFEPITNAMRIRAMSDEELAEFLEQIVSGNRDVIGINCENSKCESWKCTECIGRWLQKQVEG